MFRNKRLSDDRIAAQLDEEDEDGDDLSDISIDEEDEEEEEVQETEEVYQALSEELPVKFIVLLVSFVFSSCSF
jgi:hypothetical protein